MSSSPIRERIVAGVRATGRMHIGNYFGAVRDFVSLASAPGADGYFFVADLHTLATSRDPEALRTQLPSIVLDYLAAGVDPTNVAVFAQSSVPETSELAWLLSALAYVRELERAPAFAAHERAGRETEPVHVGMLTYPLLMAADILGPRAHRVAVGEDQYPHVELVRDIARRFNRRYFPTEPAFFPEPEVAAVEPVRVPGLDGSGKMGKSRGNTLAIMDTAEERRAKLEPAPTARRADREPGAPERCGIYAMHQLVNSAQIVAEVADGCRSGGLSCGRCKQSLNEGLETVLVPIQVRRDALSNRPGLVAEVLHAGASRARPLIAETREIVQDKLGIVRY